MEENEVIPVKKSKGKGVLIALLLLMLIGSGVGNFMFWSNEKSATATVNSKIDSLNTYHNLKDSLYAALSQEEQKVVGLRAEIALYQSDNDSLKQLLDASMAKISSLRAMVADGGSTGKLRALKDSLSRLSSANMTFKTQVDSLLNQNEDYLARLEASENRNNTLEYQKRILSEKVDIAAQPNVGPINVTPVYIKKGVYLPIYKSKKVERLQITFEVLGNKLTDKAIKKDYMVRVMDPDGIVLSNNNTKVSNSDDLFTVKESITFNGVQQKIKSNYSQTPSYKKGKYKVELKEGDEVKQTSSFELQ